MRRVMSIWLPMLPVDALRRRARAPDQRPILILRTDARKRVVACCCERARAAGVRPGLPLSQARAVLDVEPRTADLDDLQPQRMLRALALWAERLAPIVAVDDEPEESHDKRGRDLFDHDAAFSYGLQLDVSGCEVVFRGETRLASLTLESLAALGFRARVAIAPSGGSAWALARYGPRSPLRVDAAGVRGALEPLPIEALRLSRRVVDDLALVGVRRVGELLRLPRASLSPRYGNAVLLRIDQALGQAIEPLHALRKEPPLCVQRTFDGPTTHTESIELCCRHLLEELLEKVQTRESGVRRLDVTLGRIDLPDETISLVVARPTRNHRHLWHMLRPRLERVQLGHGVESVVLTVVWIGRLMHEQLVTDPTHADMAHHADAGELIDVLANRLGRERVRRAHLVASHIPERASSSRPAIDAEAPEPAALAPVVRPALLLPRPVPIRVLALTPDGPVCRVFWDEAGGDNKCENKGETELRVDACLGPERIAAEWWADASGGAPHRDYFHIRDSRGRWLWIFRESARWFIHGVSA